MGGPQDGQRGGRGNETGHGGRLETETGAGIDPFAASIERMDRVAVLWGEITAATRAFLAALAESDRHRDWAVAGFGTCAEWLAWRIGVTRNTANEKVRAARALEGLPLISDAMARGELSFSKVRALTRAATPENEAELLEFARAGSASTVERLVRSWKELSRSEELTREQARQRTRRFSVFPDDDGMYVVRGRLTPEVAAVLMRAVEAASDALFRSGADRRSSGEHAEPPQEEPGGESLPCDESVAEARRRRADALGLIAERALAAGFEAGPISGSRAERYQVMLHVDQATLSEHGEPGRSELEDGTRVTAETARRLACDASRVVVRHGNERGRAPDPAVVGTDARTRTVPSATRRALEARDRGCRFPGCHLRFTDAHHIIHWADGGPSTLDNLVLLCRRHHTRVHEGGFRVFSDKDGEGIVFFTGGRAMAAAPPAPDLGTSPADRMIARNRDRGAVPHPDALRQRYRGYTDIPWSIEAAAREALDSELSDDDTT